MHHRHGLIITTLAGKTCLMKKLDLQQILQKLEQKANVKFGKDPQVTLCKKGEKMKNIALILMLLIPFKAAYASDKEHIRNDEKYDYSFDLSDDESFNYYVDNPIIKEGDFIRLNTVSEALRYCKGSKHKRAADYHCLYNGRPFKRVVTHNIKKGYRVP